MPQRSPEPADLIERLDAILKESDRSTRHRLLRELAASVRAEDVAEALGHFSTEQKVEIFRALPPEVVPEVLDETDTSSARELVAQMAPPDLTEVVERMPPDEATDLVGDLEESERHRVLAELEPETAGEVLRLLQHHPESAGGIMTSDFIAVGAERTAREVLEHVQRTLDSEVVTYVYVVDEEGRLEGVFSIRDLLKADPATPVADFMARELITAHVEDDQEKVATLARKYNLNSIPVVDDDGRLVGVATIDDILDVLAEEADEDIYRLAGTADSHPARQRMVQRALVRIPWLFLPVLSGLTVAWLHEEGTTGTGPDISLRITLVAFLPLVMGISGAVGTQSATMMVRGMATGEIERGRSRKVFMQEFGIGILIALAIAGVVMIGLSLLGGIGVIEEGRTVAPAVGLGLAGGIVLANLFGTLFPIGCRSIGLDPALVAGPFITSLNDVVAATTYLGITQLALSWLG